MLVFFFIEKYEQQQKQSMQFIVYAISYTIFELFSLKNLNIVKLKKNLF